MDLKEAIYGRRAVREFTAKPVDEEVLRQLIDAAVQAPSAVNQQPWLFTVVRDKALLETMYASGLRVSELVGLKQSNILADETLVRVFGKGSKERIVPIGGSALRWIARYKTECRSLFWLLHNTRRVIPDLKTKKSTESL